MERGQLGRVVLIVTVVVGGGTVVKHLQHAQAPSAQAAVALAPSAPPDAGASAPARDARSELERRARGLHVDVLCGGERASGVVAGPELVMLPAHALCDDLQTLKVETLDGRRLSVSLERRDDVNDVALLFAVGVQAADVDLGDSTRLDAHELAQVGIPDGGWLGLARRSVRDAHPAVLGTAGVFLEVDPQPDPEGLPVLNCRGELVGMTSSRQDGSGREGWVLPIEYAVAPPASAATGWKRALADAKTADDAERGRWQVPSKPRLVGVLPRPQGLSAVFLSRSTTEFGGGLPLVLERRDGASCQAWAELAPASDPSALLDGPAAPARLQWLARAGRLEGTRALVATLHAADDCRDPSPQPSRVLLQPDEQVRIALSPELVARLGRPPAEPLRPAVSEQERAAQARRAEAAASEAASEARWRARFAAARAKIAQAEADGRAAQAERDQLATRMAEARADHRYVYPMEVKRWETLNELIPRIPETIARAQEELHDLEREAANEGIPLDWRR